MELIGWISGIFLGICAMPQAYKTYRTQTAQDISWAFLLLWLGGEITGLAYGVYLSSTPLVFNYVLNSIIIAYILKVKIHEQI